MKQQYLPNDRIEEVADFSLIPYEIKSSYDAFRRCHFAVKVTIDVLYNSFIKTSYGIEPDDIKGEIVDCNFKCNRKDKNDIQKKRGILGVIFKGAPLPELSLVWKKKWRMNKKGKNESFFVFSVNDGGHRSRTIIEFKLNHIATGADCYFVDDDGRHIPIANMTYEEIKLQHPKAIEEFDQYLLGACLQWNLTAKQVKEDIDDRNMNTLYVGMPKLNGYDENIIADFIRNCTTDIKENYVNPHPALKHEEKNKPHKLFDKDVLGFEDSNMVYDEIAAKILKMVWDGIAEAKLDWPDLDSFYQKGSFAGTDQGEIVKDPKKWTRMIKETENIFDFLYEILNVWDKKLYNKDQSVIHALTRWYFKYKEDLKKENATFQWDTGPHLEYKKFAYNFAENIMLKNLKDDTLDYWIKNKSGKEAIKRTKSDVFKGYLGIFSHEIKTAKSIEFIMEDFYKDIPSKLDNSLMFEWEASWGIKTYDLRKFKSKDIKDRWLTNKKRTDLSIEIDGDKAQKVDIGQVHGDHDIPRSWGRWKGGITELSNLKILLENDNIKKLNHMDFKDFVELKRNQTNKITKINLPRDENSVKNIELVA